MVKKKRRRASLNLIKTSIRLNRFFLIVLIPVLFAVSCSKSKGDFAFKRFHDGTFKKISSIPEFSSDEEIKWIYRFRKKTGNQKIGVIIQKKEVVWVDIFTGIESISPTYSIINGIIKELKPGDYKIILSDMTDGTDIELIDEKEFIIYNKDDDSID